MPRSSPASGCSGSSASARLASARARDGFVVHGLGRRVHQGVGPGRRRHAAAVLQARPAGGVPGGGGVVALRLESLGAEQLGKGLVAAAHVGQRGGVELQARRAPGGERDGAGRQPLGLGRTALDEHLRERDEVLGSVGGELRGLAQRRLALGAGRLGKPARQELPCGRIVRVRRDRATRQLQRLSPPRLLGPYRQRPHVSGVLAQRLLDLGPERVYVPLDGEIEPGGVHLGGREHPRLDTRIDRGGDPPPTAGHVARVGLQDGVERLGPTGPLQAPLGKARVPGLPGRLEPGQPALEGSQRFAVLGGQRSDEQPCGGVATPDGAAAPVEQLPDAQLALVLELLGDQHLRRGAHGPAAVERNPGHRGEIGGEPLGEPARLVGNRVQRDQVRHLVRDDDLLVILGQEPPDEEALPPLAVEQRLTGDLAVPEELRHLLPVSPGPPPRSAPERRRQGGRPPGPGARASAPARGPCSPPEPGPGRCAGPRARWSAHATPGRRGRGRRIACAWRSRRRTPKVQEWRGARRTRPGPARTSACSPPGDPWSIPGTLASPERGAL